MSAPNHDILRKNIRSLMESRGTKQAELAESIGMSQPNLSKALKPDDKKRFTLDQVFQISQYFGVSMDELTGNKAADQVETSPQAVLNFLTMLYRDKRIKFTRVTEKELVYEPDYDSHGYPDCDRKEKQIEYLAFFFPSYLNPYDYTDCEEEFFELDAEYCYTGNESKFLPLNEILQKFLPVVKLYREKEIPDDAFKMILNGYLEQLPNK